MGFSGTPKDMGPPYGKRDPYYFMIQSQGPPPQPAPARPPVVTTPAGLADSVETSQGTGKCESVLEDKQII